MEKSNLMGIVLVIALIVGISGLSWGMYKGLRKLKPKPYSDSSIVRDAMKRDECIKNGFDYEFVENFNYIGVICTKP
jgi:hypothetical protein